VKRLVAYILLLALFLPALRKAEVMASFYSNRNYIEQNLCENREEPEKQCHGCCYLAKQLKKTEEGSDKASKNSDKPGSREERSLSPYLLHDLAFRFEPVAGLLAHTGAYLAFLPEAPVFAHFHPPGMTV